MRLTKKLAEEIDGVNLSGRHVGDVLDLPPQEARLLLAEEWAFPERRFPQSRGQDAPGRRHDDPRTARGAHARRHLR